MPRMIPKIEHQLIKTVWKSTGELQKDFTQNSDLQFRFCPFKIILGAINSTNAGYKPPTSVPNDFNSFSKIFTGREAILAVWKNSFDLIEPDLSTGINATGKKVLKVGDVFYGNVVSDQLGITYSASPANNAFIQEQAIKNVVINIPNDSKNYEFINNLLDNLYHLYLIPEINAIKGENNYTVDRQWYFLEVANKVYNNENKELAYIQATFSSLNDKLATSGLAINQYVQLGAVGEPVAMPTLDLNKNIILDPDYESPRPVTHCQVTFYGTVGKIAIALWGRNINNDDKTTITMNPTKLIFPYNYQASTYDPVSFNGLPETNYVLTVGAKSTVDTYLQWQEIIAPSYDDNSKKTFEGHILTDVEKTTNTNKLDDTGKYTPYWDEKFLNNTSLDTDNFSTLGNPYFIYYNKNTKKLIGKLNYIINNLNFKNLRNLNALMYFIYNPLNEIPLSVRETIKIQANTIPVFGSFFNFFTGGMDVGFKKVSNLLIPRFDIINFFMSAELYKFYTTVLYSKQTEKNIMPYDIFRNGTVDSIPALLGTSSHMSSFTFNLTDNLKLATYDIDNDTIVENKYMNSVNLAQLNPTNDKQIYLLPKEEDFDLQPPIFNNQYNGFYIDMIDILVQGKCNFKLTFYSLPNDYNGAVSDEFSIWSGTYQTVAKASDNIRLIKNNFVLANNTYSFKNKYNYPKQVNPPPPTTIPNTIFIDLTGKSLINSDKSQNLWTGYKIQPNNLNDLLNNNFWILLEIKISDYDYNSWEDFKNDYKSLSLSWNYIITANTGDDYITRSSSNPIVIDDINKLPVYESNNDYVYGNNDIHKTDGTLVNGYNCNFKLYSPYGTNRLDSYDINVLPLNKFIKVDDTNINPPRWKTASAVTLWKSLYFNNNNKSICINIIILRTKFDDFQIGGGPVGHSIKFNNIQISPRLV